MDCITLRKRYQAQKALRNNVEGAFDLIGKYIMPFSGSFGDGYDSELSKNWRARDLYDSTAVLANQNLAANIHAGLTNPVVRWFDIVFRDAKLKKDSDAKKWLELCSNQVFVTLQESNFNLEVNETYLDLTSFGTSILVEEVREKGRQFEGLDFKSTPLHEAFFEDDSDGKIIYFYRAMEWTPLQIVEKFGEENLPKDIKKLVAESKDADERKTVIFAIFPREGVDRDPSEKYLAPELRPFGYKYFLEDTGEQLGSEGGYYEMPAFVPRWRKTSGSKWGHSPGMICLSDVLTLNELVRLVLKAAEKVVDPPILTTRRGVFGDIDTDAGGVTVVAAMDAFKPYESGARFDVSSLTKQELQQSIRQTFFMDQLQLKDSPAMTATEVQVRYELMQRLMGPTLSRLQYDFLDPLVQRTFRVLYRLNRLPEAPASVKNSKAEFDIEYTGPMARAQKADQVAAIERWLGTLAQLAEGYPQLMDLPDVDRAGILMGEFGGVPLEIIRDLDQVKTDRRKKEKAMQEERQLALMEQGSQVAKNLGQSGLAGGGNGAGQAAGVGAEG